MMDEFVWYVACRRRRARLRSHATSSAPTRTPTEIEENDSEREDTACR